MVDERKTETQKPSYRRGGREPYPMERRDDAIELTDETGPAAGERRSFAPGVEIDESWLGPRGDPAEGKR
ncbi:MAG: hypothetical protein ACREE0_22315 [Phenylobacterium sp.]